MSPSPSHVALTTPLQHILSLHSSSSTSNPPTHEQIVSSFQQLALSPPYVSKESKKGSLVRVRVMIIDTTKGEEIVPSGLSYRHHEEMDGEEFEHLSNVGSESARWEERSVFMAEEVENGWIRESLGFPPRFHDNYILKIYDRSLASSLRSTSVLDCVGIHYPPTIQLSQPQQTSESLDESLNNLRMDDIDGSESINDDDKFPSIHVIYTNPIEQPKLESPGVGEALNEIRKELIDYLAGGLSGDKFAAEWLLLSLLGRIHTRNPPIGRLSLSISYPTAQTTIKPDIFQRLELLIPRFVTLQATLDVLNDTKEQYMPTSDGETFSKGRLQQPDLSVVGVDMSGLTEGTLNERGLRNLKALQKCIKDQKLDYIFPFSTFSFDTDLGFIILSQGSPIITTDAVIAISPSTSTQERADSLNFEQLHRLRGYLYHLLHQNSKKFSLSDDLRDHIATSYSSWRKLQNTPSSSSSSTTTRVEPLTDESKVPSLSPKLDERDLGRRIEVMRLLALSFGEAEVSVETWERAVRMDEERMERLNK